MNKLSKIKLNLLMENLYLEGAVNKIYEEASDFDWIGDIKDISIDWVKPEINLGTVERDEDGWPLQDGNGEGEIWLDVSNTTKKEKMEILDSVKNYLGTLYYDNPLQSCLGDAMKGYLLHCGHEENHFFSQENHICCVNTSYENFIELEKRDYPNMNVIDRPRVDGRLFLNSTLNESEDERPTTDTKGIIKDIVDDLGLSAKFVTTFGTGIGAFMEPVTKLLEGSGVYLDKESIVLLIITAISFIISDTDFNKLKEEVRNKGLLNHLKGVVTFVKGSTNIMKSVLNKVSSASYGLTDILGFTFILAPVMNVLSELINDYGITSETVSQLLTGLTAGVATYGVKSVIKRLKNKL